MRFLFNLATVLFIWLAASVILSAALVNCEDIRSCEQKRIGGLDQGRKELPVSLPWFVGPHPNSSNELGFDPYLINEAVSWWNAQLSRDGTKRFYFVLSANETTPNLVVETGYTGKNESKLSRSLLNGKIATATIIISSDIAYHQPTVRAALKRELGAALGLAYDPGPPETVDLNSVMAYGVQNGELTSHDFELLIR